jgi:hypothetical protein
VAAYCACCGAEITLKAEACVACGAPQHGMIPTDKQKVLRIPSRSVPQESERKKLLGS